MRLYLAVAKLAVILQQCQRLHQPLNKNSSLSQQQQLQIQRKLNRKMQYPL